MRKLLVIAVSLFLLHMMTQALKSQEMADSTAQQELMERSMMLAQPSDEHKLLQKLAGEWDYTTTMWPQPGVEPMEFIGKSSGKMILGGRFLQGEFTLEAGEMSAAGLFIMGFDRRHEEYTYVGFDSWGTYWISAAGKFDEESSSITMYGEYDDPVLGYTQQYDLVVTFTSDDTWTFEVIYYDDFHTQGADGFRMAKVEYRRAE